MDLGLSGPLLVEIEHLRLRCLATPERLVSMGPLGRPRTLVIIEIARKRSTNECILEREDHTAADQFEEISSPK